MTPRHPAELLELLGISPSLIAARGLRLCSEALKLEVAELGVDGKEHLLIPEAAAAWRTLKHAAEQAGVNLFIVSAHRSVERQAEIIQRKLKAGQKMEDILCVSAPPGFSEHHTGRAVDVATAGSPPLEEHFDRTPAFAWLRRHAAPFGFKLSYPVNNEFGYRYEPWHWCFTADQQTRSTRTDLRMKWLACVISPW